MIIFKFFSDEVNWNRNLRLEIFLLIWVFLAKLSSSTLSGLPANNFSISWLAKSVSIKNLSQWIECSLRLNLQKKNFRCGKRKRPIIPWYIVEFLKKFFKKKTSQDWLKSCLSKPGDAFPSSLWRSTMPLVKEPLTS